MVLVGRTARTNPSIQRNSTGQFLVRWNDKPQNPLIHEALRQRYKDNRIIAVFEPRSRSSRLSIFEEQYKKAFAHADHVIIAAVFNPEDARRFGPTLLDVDQLITDIAATGKTAITLESADAIVTHLAPEMRDGDVIAVMSNGGFDQIHDKLLSTLRVE